MPPMPRMETISYDPIRTPGEKAMAGVRRYAHSGQRDSALRRTSEYGTVALFA
jgi:enoyl-[acyl-carrier-protein] reductase (NADH)